MYSKPGICGKCLGPVGKGDLSANSSAASSRVNVVQDMECWTMHWCGLILFFGVESVVGNPSSAVKQTFPSPLLISKVSKLLIRPYFLQCIAISVHVITDQTFRSLISTSGSNKTN